MQSSRVLDVLLKNGLGVSLEVHSISEEEVALHASEWREISGAAHRLPSASDFLPKTEHVTRLRRG